MTGLPRKLPFDLARRGSTDLYPQFGDELACLFEQLDNSGYISSATIARLELPLVPVLGRDRPNLSIRREVFKNPVVFADLVAFGVWPCELVRALLDHGIWAQALQQES